MVDGDRWAVLDDLLREGGAIVDASKCSAFELAEARIEGRLFLEPSGIGYVRRTRAWLAAAADQSSSAAQKERP